MLASEETDLTRFDELLDLYMQQYTCDMLESRHLPRIEEKRKYGIVRSWIAIRQFTKEVDHEHRSSWHPSCDRNYK
jgi:hypothetical protein